MTALLLAALLVAAPPAPTHAPTLALTVSGGVSLGAYQAGYLHYSMAVRQANPWIYRLAIATGASAGSVNALLSLQAHCGGPAADPREGLFYRVWIPMGLRQLHQPGAASPVAAFSQESFAGVGAMVEEELRKGLPESCDVVLGVVASRLDPRLVDAADGRLRVPSTVEHFVLRIQGRGPGRLPRITNYVDRDSPEEQALLPEDAAGEVPFAHLLDAVIASTSFPVAFPPRTVRHCMVRTRGAAPPLCPESRAEAAPFVDGGVFDNAPLRLAATVAAGGLAHGPGRTLRWRDSPRLTDGREPPSGVAFAFVAADAAAFPDQPARQKGADASLLPLLAEQVGGFVNSARSRELVQLIQEFPTAAEELVYPRRHLPAASSPMFAFFGFLDQGFREFDFALGMVEARRQFTEFVLPRLPEEARRAAVFPEDAAAARASPGGWQEFACLLAVSGQRGDLATACAGEALARTRILAQVSLDRLWDRCRPGSTWEPPPGQFPACDAARDGKPPPRVPGVAGNPDWRLAEGEAESTQVTRLLAAYGYPWTDAAVPPGATPDQALAALRGELLGVAESLAAAQPRLGERVTVGAAGRVAADLFFYLPPRATGWLTLGRSLEVGGDWAVRELSWFRLTAAVEVLNVLASLGSNPPPIAFVPVVGAVAMPRSLGSPLFQPSFLLRGGWVLSPHDSFGSGPCEGTDALTVGACTRPALEAGAAAAITGVVRIQLMAAWYPPSWKGPGLWALLPSLGIQLGL
ncbi:MAG TPA: patatin-like phospholipase family protein [Anaeromyxobacteraceae bacterium]|nr:patatin-like phospholipase family protein [Anaeromyxobacteraceae bacterium]